MQSKKPAKLLDREALMNYAARSLSRRAQSISELRNKLVRKAAVPEDVADVLARLKESGLVNDQQFAGSFANWRKENQGLGKTRVLRDLMSRRVASAVAKQAVEAVFEGSDETAMIEQFLARKYRGKDLNSLLQEEKHLASAFRRLRLAGFSAGNSIRVLKRFAAEAERLEEMDEDESREE
jgi:regulatory protein